MFVSSSSTQSQLLNWFSSKLAVLHLHCLKYIFTKETYFLPSFLVPWDQYEKKITERKWRTFDMVYLHLLPLNTNSWTGSFLHHLRLILIHCLYLTKIVVICLFVSYIIILTIPKKWFTYVSPLYPFNHIQLINWVSFTSPVFQLHCLGLLNQNVIPSFPFSSIFYIISNQYSEWSIETKW